MVAAEGAVREQINQHEAKKDDKPQLSESNVGPELLSFIREQADRMCDIEEQVKALNDEKKLIRQKVVEKGINRHAFKRAVSRRALTETDRNEQELSYQICCKALGVEHEQIDFVQELADTSH